MTDVKYAQRIQSNQDGIVEFSTYRFPEKDLLHLPRLKYLDLAYSTNTFAERFLRLYYTEVVEPRLIRELPPDGRVLKRADDDSRTLIDFWRPPPGLFDPPIEKDRRADGTIDWIGRNLFLGFMDGMLDRPEILESGEGALRFMNLASRLGYDGWKNTSLEGYHDTLAELLIPFAYPFIIKGFYKIRGEHPLLLREFLDMFSFSSTSPKTVRYVFDEVPDEEHLEFLLDVGNKTRFDFWGVREAVDWEALIDIISKFLKTDRSHMIWTLVNYGISFEKIGDYACCSQPYCIRAITPRRYQEGTQALLWAIGFAHIATTRSLITTPEFSVMHRKLVLSLPYPRASLRALLWWLEREFPSFIQWSGEAIVEAYLTSPMHPEDRPEGEPVRLSHQCRYVVRERLRENYQLPHGIDSLPAPARVKMFLNIEDP